jgi:ABC-type transport system involved in cytochrome c biogenesis ATPase subunit
VRGGVFRVDRRPAPGEDAGVLPAAALVRALALTAGAAALRRGLLFGGNGLSPATVVAGAETSTPARALLWAAWLIVTAPTLEALWRTRASFWLRSLPAPRAWHVAGLLAMSALAHSPWAALWWVGGGPVAGIAALGGSLAGHAALLGRPDGPRGLAVLAAVAAALAFAPLWALALGTWPIVLVLFRAAWRAAPARPARADVGAIAGPAAIALMIALLLELVRGHAPALWRAILLVGLAISAAALAAGNNAVGEPSALLLYACGFFTPAAIAGGSAIAGPMLLSERRAEWLLAVAGASARVRLAAHTLASAGVGAALGVGVGAFFSQLFSLPLAHASRTIAVMTVAGSSLTALAGLSARWAAGFGTRGPGRLVALLLVIAVATVASLMWIGPVAPLVWAGAAGLIWLIKHVRSGDDARVEGGGGVLLDMHGVRKRLGLRVVLQDVALRCDRGELVLVLGENGAGKSTLLRIAAGIVEPDAGAVRVDGAPIATVAARRALGYAPDTSEAFPELSVRELIELVAAIRRAPDREPALRERLGLAAVWRQRMRTLSFGQVKRAYLLAATVGGPPLWLLDEPSNGLDPDGVRLAAELLREHVAAGGGAVVTTNDAGFAALLDATRTRLRDGQLVTA